MPEILWFSFEKPAALENMGAAEGTQTHVEMFEEFWCGLQGKTSETKHKTEQIENSSYRPAPCLLLPLSSGNGGKSKQILVHLLIPPAGKQAHKLSSYFL